MDKPTLIAKRQEFYEQILVNLKKPPSRIDMILNQDKFYVHPDEKDTFIASESGDMVIHINGRFYEKDFNIFYIFWQLGDMLKIGIAINDLDLQGAFASDSHNEIYYIWGIKNDPKVDVARGCVFYDWEFEVPELYSNYKNQEKFLFGVRHMHFRAMRIIHDECERIFFDNDRNSVEDSDDSDEITCNPIVD